MATYRSASTTTRRRRRLRPAEQEVPVIGFIFRRVIETGSPCTVANEANARGYRTKRADGHAARSGRRQEIGGKRFDEDMVTAIVRNPVYKGFLRYNGRLYPGAT